MKRHLTKRELIEYQFELVSEVLTAKTAAHLQGCSRCREHLTQLRRKFASLDLLREDVDVSEELISRVIKQAGRPVRMRVPSLSKPAWIGAAAAVLLMGSLLTVSHFNTIEQGYREHVRGPLGLSTEAKFDERVAAKEPADRHSAADRIFAFAEMEAAAPPGEPIAAGVLSKAQSTVSAADTPPFAPASAIELVTLPRRDKVQITIYNSADLTLVRERRNLTLKKDWNWLQFMWANTLIDPTSLQLEPLEQKDRIDIQQLVFPARLRELGRWLIRSEVSGQVPFEITYFTSGLSWRAFYMGTLSADEQKMKLQGYVRVSNDSGEDYENAQTRLIVGQVHILDEIVQLASREYPYGRPIAAPEGRGRYGGGVWCGYGDKDKVAMLGDTPIVGGLFKAEELRRKEIRKEGLSEYFLYTIEGTETIPDKWGKRLLSFDAAGIEVEGLYKYDEQRWGNQTIRFVKFANDEDHNLGKTPIPNGDVRIYVQTGEQGNLLYVGGTNIKYIPVGEEVELNLGPARLVSVEPTLMDFRTENYVFDRKKNIAGWDEIRAWKVEITNTRQLPVEVEITRGFRTAYWKLQSDIHYEKHDATHARFKTTLEPGTSRAFNYTITTYHGVREITVAQ